MSEIDNTINKGISDVFLENTPELRTVKCQQPRDESISAGTVDETMLTEDERKRITQIANSIDIKNISKVVSYGVEAQRNISDFSVSILKKVKTYDMGEVGESLRSLTVALDATVEPEKRGILRVFRKAKNTVGAIRANYAKAESNVDKIEGDLLNHEAILIQDISIYQEMYELNAQYYKELTIYILAGKKALERTRKEQLDVLRKKAEASNTQENVQAYRDLEDLCHRFEKKISDLEITRFIAIQSAPQVRMLQNNERELLDKLQSSIANTIPLWRNQLVLSLGIEHTHRSAEAQKTLSDKTNELLIKNSETLKMATIETAKAAERPLVDMDTLAMCNKNLISSIREVVEIHAAGVGKRKEVRNQLMELEQELKRVMLQETNAK